MWLFPARLVITLNGLERQVQVRVSLGKGELIWSLWELWNRPYVLILVLAAPQKLPSLPVATTSVSAPLLRMQCFLWPEELWEPYFTATTTTASNFTYASTTALSAESLCLTGDDCVTTWPTGGSGIGWASSTDPTSIYFTGSGNVGIGTTSPYAKLSVVGETVAQYFTATSTTATSTFAGDVNIGSGAAGDSIMALYAGNSFVWSIGLDDSDSDKFKISTSTDFSAGNIFTIDPTTGNVGIGTTSPYAMLSVAGGVVGAYFTATTTIASIFTYASTTALSAESLCLTGDDCVTTWPTGGSGVGTVSTSSTPTIGNLAYWTSSGSWPETLGTVATTTLTGTYPISVSNSPVVIGASQAFITFPATSTLYGTGTGGQVLAWSGSVPTWVATTTFSTGLTYSAGAVTCNTASGSALGCLSAANWNTFNNKIGTSSVPTIGNLAYWTGAGTPSTLSTVATTSLSATSPLVLTNPPSVVGTTSASLTCNTASVSAAGCLSLSDFQVFNNKVATTSIDTIAELNAILTGEDVASTTWTGATSITTLGTIANGTWQGASIGTAYGGTGLGGGGLKAGYIPFGAGTSAFATSTNLFWDSANFRLGIGTTTPYATLSVAGQTVAAYFTATTTATSTFPYLSATRGAFTDLVSCDTIDTDAGGFLKCGTDSTGTGSGTVGTSTSETAGYLSYWTSNSATPALLGKVATTTLSLSGLDLTGGTLGTLVGGNNATIASQVGTSTVPSVSNLAYWTGAGTPSTLSAVATTTLSATAPLVLTNPPYVVGTTTATLTCNTASVSAAGCLALSDFQVFNNKVATTSIDTIAELNNILTGEDVASTTWTGATHSSLWEQ